MLITRIVRFCRPPSVGLLYCVRPRSYSSDVDRPTSNVVVECWSASLGDLCVVVVAAAASAL